MILDEVLSVGDAKFREKSLDRMKTLLDQDVSVLFVSHTLQQVRDLCNKAIWLENGRVMMQGPVDEVCDSYERSVLLKEKIYVKKSDPMKNDAKVPLDKDIILTFNEPIKIGSNWVELLSANRVSVPLEKYVEGNKLTIKHPILQPGMRYNLHLHTGCYEDMEGNKVNTYSTGFTTEVKK